MNPVRVGVVARHPVTRAGLRAMLTGAQGLDVVGESPDVRDAAEMATRAGLHVVVLDPTGQGESAQRCVELMCEPGCPWGVVVMGSPAGARTVREAIAGGARGFLSKDAGALDLASAVREVAAGRRFVPPDLGAALALEPRDGAKALSHRERQVLELLARGYTNQEVAERLFVSVRTVEGHRASVFRKLGVASRAALVDYALRRGLLGVGVE